MYSYSFNKLKEGIIKVVHSSSFNGPMDSVGDVTLSHGWLDSYMLHQVSGPIIDSHLLSSTTTA